MSEENSNENKEHKKNILEYIVFWVSLVFVVVLLGYLTYQTFTSKNDDPIITMEFESRPNSESPFLYHVTVYNRAFSTAEDVEVELILEKDDEKLESSVMKIPYLPGKSKREVWMNFSKDPQKADTVYSRVVSYSSS